MKTILRNFFASFRRYTASGVLNILGLTAALTSFYVITVQVDWELTYNRCFADADRIFRVEMPSWESDDYSAVVSRLVAERCIAASPDVEAAGVFNGSSRYDVTVVRGDGTESFTPAYAAVTASIVDVLGLEIVAGDASEFSAEKRKVLLSQSRAEQLGLGVGDTFYMGSNTVPERRVEVAAVYRDLPDNSMLGTNPILKDMGDESIDDFSEWSYCYYVRLHEASARERFEQTWREQVRQLVTDMGAPDLESVVDRMSARLTPLADTYFCKDCKDVRDACGNSTTVYILFGVSLLIVAIALINFINFFFAMVPVRIRAVNTFKIFGASASSLRAGFIFEAAGLVAAALLIGWWLVSMLSGSDVASLFSTSLAVGDNPRAVIFTLLAAAAIVLVGSVYPAYYITSFAPAFVIKGSFASSPSGRALRNVLVGLQFVISISMVIAALSVKMQHSYMMNRDIGFDKENLLTMYSPGPRSDALTADLKNIVGVKDVGWAAGDIVIETRMGWGRELRGERISFQCYPVSNDFLRVLGIEITEGRDFRPEDELKETGTFIFNETARRTFGLELDDRIAGHAGETDIAGFCRDFNFKPLQYGIEPFAFYVYGSKPWWELSYLLVRTEAGADLRSVIDNIRSTVYGYYPVGSTDERIVAFYDVRFFDDDLGILYAKEARLTKLVTLFTLVSVAIALMGVFGLVLFETQHRRREITVRKVYGATTAEILRMFNRKFMIIVLVCFAIAAPLTYWGVDRWLGNFAYRTPVYWWIFLLALAVVAVITSLTVTVRSYSAANANPADAVKTE